MNEELELLKTLEENINVGSHPSMFEAYANLFESFVNDTPLNEFYKNAHLFDKEDFLDDDID